MENSGRKRSTGETSIQFEAEDFHHCDPKDNNGQRARNAAPTFLMKITIAPKFAPSGEILRFHPDR